MKEEILSTKIIFDGRIIHLRVHQVRLPDGNETIRELIEHQGAVAIVAIDNEGYVLLVKQYRIGAGQALYEVPAGLLELGEEPETAVIRELREETGYRPIGLESLGGIYLAPGYSTEYIHLFIAKGYESAPLQQDSDEFVQSLRIPIPEALEMIDKGEIIEAKSIAALLKAARKLGL